MRHPRVSAEHPTRVLIVTVVASKPPPRAAGTEPTVSEHDAALFLPPTSVRPPAVIAMIAYGRFTGGDGANEHSPGRTGSRCCLASLSDKLALGPRSAPVD